MKAIKSDHENRLAVHRLLEFARKKNAAIIIITAGHVDDVIITIVRLSLINSDTRMAARGESYCCYCGSRSVAVVEKAVCVFFFFFFFCFFFCSFSPVGLDNRREAVHREGRRQ